MKKNTEKWVHLEDSSIKYKCTKNQTDTVQKIDLNKIYVALTGL